MEWDCNDWLAIHDHQPVGPATLRVTGKCTMPSPGYTCELSVHKPQGINPSDLLLDLIVNEPSVTEPQVVTPCEVRFEWPTETEYESVSVIDVAMGIPVEEVSA